MVCNEIIFTGVLTVRHIEYIIMLADIGCSRCGGSGT